MNTSGQLGDGTNVQRRTPVNVTGLSSGAVGLTAGWFHACAVMNDGSVKCWGSNVLGQLGDGTTVGSSTPVTVNGLPGAMSTVSGGRWHTCGVSATGRATCWGDNQYGQLGDGTLIDSPTPVNVATLSSGVAQISASIRQTCARTTAGGAKCWGDNEFAQLGNDGAPVDSAIPVDVVGLTSGVTAISSGGVHGCVLTTRIEAQCWGANAVGQVGDGTGTQRNAPVYVPGYGHVLAIDDVFVGEGDSGMTPATFTITLAEPSPNDVIVDWGTVDGTATAGSDYTPSGGTITIWAGETTRECAVPVHGDTDIEPTEIFTVELANSFNAAIADGMGTARVLDDDRPLVSIDDVSVSEGDSGIAPATFTVSLFEPSPTTVSVQWSTVDVDALAGTDYVAASGVATFLPGDVDEPIFVDIYGDTAVEPDESFEVVLVQPDRARRSGDASGVGTIVNDDAATLSIGDVTVTEGNSATTRAALMVTLSAPSTLPVTVDFATADSSATSPADFAAASGTLTFDPGETAQEILVDVVGDTLDETNETFAADLTNPTNATIGDTFAIVTTPTTTRRRRSASTTTPSIEGDTGTTPLVFTICLSAASGKVITVDYATANGSAIAGTDYTATNGTLTLPVGATSAQVTVDVRGDVADEANETVTLNLSNAANATIADGTGVGTIVDDDPKPVITSFNPGRLPQGDTVTIRGSGLHRRDAGGVRPGGRRNGQRDDVPRRQRRPSDRDRARRSRRRAGSRSRRRREPGPARRTC